MSVMPDDHRYWLLRYGKEYGPVVIYTGDEDPGPVSYPFEVIDRVENPAPR